MPRKPKTKEQLKKQAGSYLPIWSKRDIMDFFELSNDQIEKMESDLKPWKQDASSHPRFRPAVVVAHLKSIKYIMDTVNA